MNTQAQVIRLLLTDVSQLVAESKDGEQSVELFIDDVGRAAEAASNELAQDILDERATADRLGHYRTELDVWERRAELAADSQDHYLVQEALRRKNAHDAILTALRDHQAEVEKAYLSGGMRLAASDSLVGIKPWFWFQPRGERWQVERRGVWRRSGIGVR